MKQAVKLLVEALPQKRSPPHPPPPSEQQIETVKPYSLFGE